MAKIQVTTADIQAKAEVIVLNAYFVANVVRVHDCVDAIIDQNKQVLQEFDEKTKELRPKLDEHGKEQYQYCDYTTQTIEERVYPFLKELMRALGIEQQPL